MEVFKENVNTGVGAAAAIMAFFLGDFWWLFLAFAVLNIVDYLTGWYKARQTQTEQSSKGAHGIAKKVGYWVIIGIAFFISVSFIEMGQLVNINLSFMPLIGYFVLITYIVNEIRSILENLVVCGVNVPDFLIKGLDVTKKLLEDKTRVFIDKEDKNC